MPPVMSKLTDDQEPGAMSTPDLVTANELPVEDYKLVLLLQTLFST